ncbi:MAG: inositol monophosphatase family protein [Elusimicrobiota bacterium]
MNPKRFAPALEEALEKSGEALRRRFGKVLIRYKGRSNLLTEADLESQKIILKIIRRAFPSHDWRAEENDSRSSGSAFLWLIDPLDGTTNYAHGYPACCVSIALLYKNKPLAAGIYDPFRDERFIALAGRGARLNGRPIRVSKNKTLAKSLLITGFPYDRAEKADFYVRFFKDFLGRCHDIRRSGSAALDLAWIAAGRGDGYWEFNLSPWDVAAGLLIVREAGGLVTNFSGGTWDDPDTFGKETLATNGLIHARMLYYLMRARRLAADQKEKAMEILFVIPKSENGAQA